MRKIHAVLRQFHELNRSQRDIARSLEVGRGTVANYLSKPLLLMFEQGSCRNCETLHDRVLSLQVSQELLKRFDVYRIDMWGRSTFKTPAGDETTGRELSNELDVSYAPTMIFYSADGAEVIRSEAYFKTFHTQSIMDYVASGAWRTQSSFQRYIAERADILREQGINVDIWD